MLAQRESLRSGSNRSRARPGPPHYLWFVATPAFILELRKKIGHDPLWVSCASGVVLDGRGRVLLGRRSDDGRWAVLGGIIDPGEEPATAVVREVAEEAGVAVAVERLSSVVSEPEPVFFPGGDQVQFLDLCFRCRFLGGQPRPLDGENAEVRWFELTAPPPLSELDLLRIRHARPAKGPTYFRT